MEAGAVAEDGVVLGIAPVLAAELVTRLEPELTSNLGDRDKVRRHRFAVKSGHSLCISLPEPAVGSDHRIAE
jgi:hypothetical protein